MNEDFSELEAELRRLRPRAVAERLTRSIEAELATGDGEGARARPRYRTAANWASWKWVGWAAIASAAVVGLSLTWKGGPRNAGQKAEERRHETADTNEFQPVAARQYHYETLDGGLVTLANGQAARQLIDRYVDTLTWRNPATRTSMQLSVPRDEVRVVPVNLN